MAIQRSWCTAGLSSALDTLARLISPCQQLSEYGNRVVQFSPQFRLSFTLLNEDAAMGSSVSDWNIQAGLARRSSDHISSEFDHIWFRTDRINPVLDRLRLLHNFTIESQVQFHGRLAFNPQPIGNRAYGLTPEDLTIFINSAEWSLCMLLSAQMIQLTHFCSIDRLQWPRDSFCSFHSFAGTPSPAHPHVWWYDWSNSLPSHPLTAPRKYFALQIIPVTPMG